LHTIPRACCAFLTQWLVICRVKDEADAMSSMGYDPETQSVIKLNNGSILYLREVNKFLALVCRIKEDKFDKHGLIDYNFQCFKKAINQVFEVSQRALKGKPEKK
jgi:Ras-related GTP-binding protein C/D